VRILVTGSDGYIGSLLGPYLAERGHDVVGLDVGFYRAGWLYNPGTSEVPTLTADIREVNASDLEGFEALVHMAELSNDPLGQLAPTITYDINHQGSVRLATAAKTAGVERLVYTSSCSVYGDAEEELVDEESPLRPQTAYAVCKERVERDVALLAADDFSPTFLRNATAFGASPRMRFDIVVNNLSGLAWTTREIRMESDGTPWRPLVHVLDICKAVAHVLEAPREVVHNQVLNVGDLDANYQIREVAEIVGRVFPGCDVTVGVRGGDLRSYRVSFAKIHELLPEFACDWNVELGARQLLEVFSAVDLMEDDFLSRSYTRLKQIEYLLRTEQIDASFFWKALGLAPTGPDQR
jgi:nucleoside-diphosphate-sugar epimerase